MTISVRAATGLERLSTAGDGLIRGGMSAADFEAIGLARTVVDDVSADLAAVSSQVRPVDDAISSTWRRFSRHLVQVVNDPGALLEPLGGAAVSAAQAATRLRTLVEHPSILQALDGAGLSRLSRELVESSRAATELSADASASLSAAVELSTNAPRGARRISVVNRVLETEEPFNQSGPVTLGTQGGQEFVDPAKSFQRLAGTSHLGTTRFRAKLEAEHVGTRLGAGADALRTRLADFVTQFAEATSDATRRSARERALAIQDETIAAARVAEADTAQLLGALEPPRAIEA